ncbi:MAG: DUF2971 domain-containing protein [Desulfobulbaceae bacterium]|nr:DUF2971 domain-containing protein [Desulfobulbaceae bacterium]
MDAPPIILYKYVTIEDAKKILQKNTLRATPPDELNDPFELLPGSFSGCSREAVIKEIMRRPEVFFDLAKGLLPFKDIYDFKEKINQNDAFMSSVVSVFSDTEFLMNNFIDSVKEFSKHIGLMCFSSNNSNILMWSHYANNHTGVIIGIESMLFSKHWIKVDYKRKRFEIPFGIAERQKNPLDVLGRKSLDWRYEEEYRTFAILKDCNYTLDSSKKSGKIYLYPFDNAAIKEVVFGINTPDGAQQILKNELKDKYGSSVVIKKAVLHKTEYKLIV